MKEMLLRLPVAEIEASDDWLQAKAWPDHDGCYLVPCDSGDVYVVEVKLRPLAQGEVRPEDENVQNLQTVNVGQVELLDPDDYVLKEEYAVCCANLEKANRNLREARKSHEAEMAEQKVRCEEFCKQAEENCQKLIKEKETEFQARYDAFKESSEKDLELRRMKLENEYKMKGIELELNTPKRFAQGEWVSGKTLTEIIRTLAGGGKEG